MTQKHLRLLFAVLLPFAIGHTFVGCKSSNNGSNVATSNDAQTQSSPVRSPLTAFARDLQDIRKGQYTYVWVFSRKDGKPLDKDDAAFLRKNAPQVVDWFTTDEGKKVIGGTNFNLEEGNLTLLKKRFLAEDYSQK